VCIHEQVLECSWDELLRKVDKAEDLDHVIEAHNAFLNGIVSRCLLDEDSRVLFFAGACVAVLCHADRDVVPALLSAASWL